MSKLQDITAMLEVLKEQEQTALAKSEFDPERAFDCKKCGAHYVPKIHQWIFWKLCDECFDAFDKQKMAHRLSHMFDDGSVEGTESLEEWLESTKQ